MSCRQLERRLVELEQRLGEQRRAWLSSLSDAEFDALLEERWPGFVAAFAAMSEADRDRWAGGTMPDAEWQEHLARAQSGSGFSGAPGPS